MLGHTPKLRHLLPPAIAFVCLHAVLRAAFRPHATAATYPFIILAPLFALFSCCWRANATSSRVRLP